MERVNIWLLPALFIIASVCLVLGLSLPILRFETFYFFKETPSLVELVGALFKSGDIALAMVVGLFSIAFPVAKLAGLGLQLWKRGREPTFLRRVMPHLSKWSMMDVMLVAIVVFAAKSSSVANAASQPGLWFYAASTVAGSILVSLIPAEANEPPTH